MDVRRVGVEEFEELIKKWDDDPNIRQGYEIKAL